MPHSMVLDLDLHCLLRSVPHGKQKYGICVIYVVKI